MSRFRTRPATIDAARWHGGAIDGELLAWLNDVAHGVARSAPYVRIDDELRILTPSGVKRVNPGDWIIKGPKGELYACKPDLFVVTYEPEA